MRAQDGLHSGGDLGELLRSVSLARAAAVSITSVSIDAPRLDQHHLFLGPDRR